MFVIFFVRDYIQSHSKMVRRLAEKVVHETEGHYVPAKILGQLGASAEGLHSLISHICHESNLTPAAAAAHVAHQVHKELNGGAAMSPHHLVAHARHLYGAPSAAHHRSVSARHHMGAGMAMGGLALGGYDGGFSFGDFVNKAKSAASAAKALAQKAMPIAQQIHSYIPQAASVLSSLGLNKLANAATSAHSTVGNLANQYGDIAKSVIGSGRRTMHKRGYVRH